MNLVKVTMDIILTACGLLTVVILAYSQYKSTQQYNDSSNKEEKIRKEDEIKKIVHDLNELKNIENERSQIRESKINILWSQASKLINGNLTWNIQRFGDKVNQKSDTGKITKNMVSNRHIDSYIEDLQSHL